jgi:DNA-binding PadR family transcriptional regulator
MKGQNTVAASDTSYAILGMLSLLGESSGYDLRRFIRQSIAFFWDASFAQVYQLLRRLESMGWVNAERVEQTARPDKVIYRLTEAGSAALHDWLSRPAAEASYRDSFLLRVFFFDGLTASARRELLAAETGAHRERLEEYNQIATTVPEMAAFPRQTLRFGMAYEELYLRWLAELADVIDTLEAQDTAAAPGHGEKVSP